MAIVPDVFTIACPVLRLIRWVIPLDAIVDIAPSPPTTSQMPPTLRSRGVFAISRRQRTSNAFLAQA
jgi:hypothetical protein